MRIFVPYTNLQPLTKFLLHPYEWVGVKLEGPLGYTSHLQARWDEQEDFINIEHDIAFWDGALEELWDCPEPWCVFAYHKNEIVSEHATPFLGCAKLTKRLMEQLPDVWRRQKTEPNGWRDANFEEWTYCDAWLWECAKEKGITCHQHFPGVINANPSSIASIP